MTEIERKLDDAGLVLPDPKTPLGAYVPLVQTGDLLYVSGQGPVSASGVAVVGRLGEGLELEDGHRAAQLCALNILAHAKRYFDGDWSRLKKIIRLNGAVNSTPDFTHQPAVLNGASELLKNLFGEAGVHTRVAVGVAALPMNWAVEIDAIIEVRG